MRTGLLIAILVGLLVLSGAAAWRVWSGLEGATMSAHGYVALAVGVTLSLLHGKDISTPRPCGPFRSI